MNSVPFFSQLSERRGVAVVVLAVSSSYIFRTFFKALCLVVLLGGGNGLWLLPVLLSIFGGDAEGAVLDGKAETAATGAAFGDGYLEAGPSESKKKIRVTAM